MLLINTNMQPKILNISAKIDLKFGKKVLFEVKNLLYTTIYMYLFQILCKMDGIRLIGVLIKIFFDDKCII